jgi:hypothetical protein
MISEISRSGSLEVRNNYNYSVESVFITISDQNRSFMVEESAQIELRDFWRERKSSVSASVSWLFNRSSAFTDAIFGRSNRDPDAKIYKPQLKKPQNGFPF